MKNEILYYMYKFVNKISYSILMGMYLLFSLIIREKNIEEKDE